MKLLERHYRIRVENEKYYPEVKILGVFWVGCAWIDDPELFFPRNIRCGSRGDAVKVIETYNRLNCPGRLIKILS